jgi:hypothetical protein
MQQQQQQLLLLLQLPLEQCSTPQQRHASIASESHTLSEVYG